MSTLQQRLLNTHCSSTFLWCVLRHPAGSTRGLSLSLSEGQARHAGEQMPQEQPSTKDVWLPKEESPVSSPFRSHRSEGGPVCGVSEPSLEDRLPRWSPRRCAPQCSVCVIRRRVTNDPRRCRLTQRTSVTPLFLWGRISVGRVWPRLSCAGAIRHGPRVRSSAALAGARGLAATRPRGCWLSTQASLCGTARVSPAVAARCHLSE